MLNKARFTEAFLRSDRRETGKTPNHSHVAPHATAAIGPSQAIAEVELMSLVQLLRCNATSDLAYDFDLFYSKVSRVASKFVQVVSNRANIKVT